MRVEDIRAKVHIPSYTEGDEPSYINFEDDYISVVFEYYSYGAYQESIEVGFDDLLKDDETLNEEALEERRVTEELKRKREEEREKKNKESEYKKFLELKKKYEE